METLEEFERQIQNLEDSNSYKNFQIQDPYSIFQVPLQQEEPIGLEKSMKNLIQSENNFA